MEFIANGVIEGKEGGIWCPTKTYYEGVINSDNTAKSISIKLDSSSTIKLLGDSYITSLDDEDTTYSNIDLNGYKLYVNGKELAK